MSLYRIVYIDCKKRFRTNEYMETFHHMTHLFTVIQLRHVDLHLYNAHIVSRLHTTPFGPRLTPESGAMNVSHWFQFPT